MKLKGCRILLPAILFLLPSFAFAQKEANNWIFGNFAYVDFNTVPPTSFDGARLSTNEGCATISDKNGKLLFYTDGSTVWNNQHKKMPNGTGLIGSNSATQAALIVPKPDDAQLYYIFTVREYGGSLAYSIVDISKDNGLGDIILKNVLLLTRSTEKLTGVHHRNGKDIWVIGHDWNSNEFCSWLVTRNGVASSPVRSATGSFHGGDTLNARGYLKVSPDGKQLAAAVTVPSNFLEIFSFDDKTGIVSNPKKMIGFQGSGPYGIEFSPNGKFLYLSEAEGEETLPVQRNLYQIALPFSSEKIADNGIILGKVFIGGLQCTPDGRIYVVDGRISSVINNPDTVGIGCNYVSYGFPLKYWGPIIGVPNFIQSYFKQPLVISATGNCTADLTHFIADTKVKNIDSIVWDFSDKLSGKDNVSHQLNPTHQYKRPGLYYITSTIYYDGRSSKSSLKMTVTASPKVDFGKDTTLYYGQKLTLKATNDQSSYQWQDGSTNAIYEVKEPGIYSVTITNKSGCSVSDTIAVNYDQIISTGLPTDTTLCVGQSLKLDVQLSGAKYQWSTGDKGSSITINDAGKYWVEITNAYNNRIRRDTISVSRPIFNTIKAITDTIICKPSALQLFAVGGKSQERYNWYDESGNLLEQNTGRFQTAILNKNNSYFVELTNGFCASAKHRINVIYDKPEAKIANRDTIIDLGASIRLKGSGGKTCIWEPSLYLSNFQILNPVATPLQDTTYRLIVFSANGCTDTASVRIRLRKLVVAPNTFTPNGDGVNDFWVIQYIDRYPLNTLTIYNRTGDVIQRFRNYSSNWNGTRNGQMLPVGTYFYVIQLDKARKQAGSVTILR